MEELRKKLMEELKNKLGEGYEVSPVDVNKNNGDKFRDFLKRRTLGDINNQKGR